MFERNLVFDANHLTGDWGCGRVTSSSDTQRKMNELTRCIYLSVRRVAKGRRRERERKNASILSITLRCCWLEHYLFLKFNSNELISSEGVFAKWRTETRLRERERDKRAYFHQFNSRYLNIKILLYILVKLSFKPMKEVVSFQPTITSLTQ